MKHKKSLLTVMKIIGTQFGILNIILIMKEWNLVTNPLMMGVDAAARTKQIRIGQACNVITFHNPIRLAEDIALLDQLSGGRVDVGIGRGIYGREAINMNKEADLKDQAKNFRLFDESLTIMKKAWTEKFFSHQGEFYTYPTPNFTWQHDMSPPSEEFLRYKN